MGYLQEHTVLSLTVATLIGCACWIAYQLFFSPFARIPGPLAAKISNIWVAYLAWRGGTHTVMIDLHKKYGNVVRIAPSIVSVGDPGAIKHIYGAGTKFTKSEWYSVWQGKRKFDLFAERDENVHSRQRKLINHAFSATGLRDSEKDVDVLVEDMLKKVQGQSATSIDLGKWIHLFAYDVIGQVTFGKAFGALERGDDEGVFKVITDALRSAAWVGYVPWLYQIHESIRWLTGPFLAVEYGRHGSIRAQAVEEVAAAKDDHLGSQSLLQKFFAMSRSKPDQFDHSDIVSMATSSIFAGSHSTASTMHAAIYYLCKNPIYKAKLVEELDVLHSDGKLSSPVSVAEAGQMPYLNACLKEAVRCHPGIGMLLPRTVPHGGFEIEEHFIPAGATVGVNAWVVHGNTDIFGDDADQFNPERWLTRSNTTAMNNAIFTFSASGPRHCLGKHIALMELSKVVATLFGEYEVSLVDAAAEWKMRSWWFVQQDGVPFRVRKREQARRISRLDEVTSEA